jgi:hypothetical protein
VLLLATSLALELWLESALVSAPAAAEGVAADGHGWSQGAAVAATQSISTPGCGSPRRTCWWASWAWSSWRRRVTRHGALPAQGRRRGLSCTRHRRGCGRGFCGRDRSLRRDGELGMVAHLAPPTWTPVPFC